MSNNSRFQTHHPLRTDLPPLYVPITNSVVGSLCFAAEAG